MRTITGVKRTKITGDELSGHPEAQQRPQVDIRTKTAKNDLGSCSLDVGAYRNPKPVLESDQYTMCILLTEKSS